MTHDKRFGGDPSRLRDPGRLAKIDPAGIVGRVLQGRERDIRTVLDIGCGSGVFTEEFIRCGCQAVGIDIRPEMVDAARQAVPGAVFKEASFDALPFKDKSYDLGFMGMVLHESDDIHTTLAEAARVCRNYLAVLEWPYLREAAGPPLEHRLARNAIAGAVDRLGGTIEVCTVPLHHELTVIRLKGS